MVADFIGGVLLLFVALLWSFAFQKRGDRGSFLFRLAILVKLAVLLVHYLVFPLPDSGADATRFMNVAARLSLLPANQFFDSFTTGSSLYPWIVSIPMRLFGTGVFFAQATNLVLGSLNIVIAYRIMRLMWPERTAYARALFLLFFPAQILYSVLSLREMFIATPCLIGVYLSARYVITKKINYYFWAGGFFVLSFLFHRGMAAVVIAWILFFVADYVRQSFKGKVQVVVLGSALLVLLVPFVYYILTFQDGFRSFLEAEGDSRIMMLSATANEARANYWNSYGTNSLFELLLTFPLRVIFFLLAPIIPFLVRSPADTLGALDAVLYLGLVSIAILRFKVLWRNPVSRLLSIYVVLLIAVFSLGTTNYGTAVRHKNKAIPLLVVVLPPWRVRQESTQRDRYWQTPLPQRHRHSRGT